MRPWLRWSLILLLVAAAIAAPMGQKNYVVYILRFGSYSRSLRWD